jgi:chemotaxis protein CheZ
VQALQKIIEETRQDIGDTRVGDVAFTHIPTATDELGAVVAATEAATSIIMDSCDNLTNKADGFEPETKDYVLGEVTKILEACSFQDITGQRINKVTRNLQAIEEKVSALVKVLADKIPGIPGRDYEDSREGDELLKNGPQMPDKAISQDDIDKLLADLF